MSGEFVLVLLHELTIDFRRVDLNPLYEIKTININILGKQTYEFSAMRFGLLHPI